MPQRDLESNPLWYKDAVLYEIHVRAFADSDGDGMGDFRGLTQKLDYLQDLGVTALWLLPFYPSPLKDDGYDIADYTDINPLYGTLRDFKVFLREAHRRGLRVITELVINHTSDQHPWFQRARRAEPGSSHRNFYVWSETPEKYGEARVIFKDFEHSNWTWDPLAKAYYWHRFYSHQPDLNFENPEVLKAVTQVLDFWLSMGVDGLRLDAVPYLHEKEGTNCENLAETHAVLKKLRRHVDSRYQERIFLAEANQWPEDAVAYFGDGDECHMAYHFPVMPRMFMAIRMEDRFPITEILAQTPTIPDSCQWGLFLRNHDELTLEMVTDEERDYMYRVYARDPEARINLGIRRRLAPLLGNHRRRIELMNGLLFSLPGTPFIYYGDEIGMGDNIYLGDRNSVRTPMQWSADRNAGFSVGNPQKLFLPVIIDPEYHYETVHVDAQQNNPHSLLWWMKRLIALRKRFKAFGRGSIEFLTPTNRKVLAFIRRYEDEIVLVVANLSRFVQFVELNLAEFKGAIPVEMFGRTEFPSIGDLPYLLTLGPHAFYWFTLESSRPAVQGGAGPAAETGIASLIVSGGWESVFREKSRDALEALLPSYLQARRWFGGKARRLKSVEIVDDVTMSNHSTVTHAILTQVQYADGDPETYLIPITFAAGDHAEQIQSHFPHAVIAQIKHAGRTAPAVGILYDATCDEHFTTVLLANIARRRRFKGATGEITAILTGAATPRELRGTDDSPLLPTVSTAEQSNTSIVYGDRLILKFFRRLTEGTNPDLEIGRFLTERTGFAHTPAVVGAMEYRIGRAEPTTVAILQRFVPNAGDAWKFTLDTLGHFFENVAAHPAEAYQFTSSRHSVLDLSEQEPPALAEETIGTYLEAARRLGERTAELHLALASDRTDPAFAPEPFSTLYQRSMYQSMRSHMNQSFQLLQSHLDRLDDETKAAAKQILDQEGAVLGCYRALMDHRLSATRIRCHGDYHLGQVLYTNTDFVIIDFEGEPARSLTERRLKHSPLRDVAGMLRSFHYAAYTALFGARESGLARAEDLAVVESGARFWHGWVAATFLKSYLAVAASGEFLPSARADLETLLRALLLEKAMYELGYELNNRPTWVKIPLKGILRLLEIQ